MVTVTIKNNCVTITGPCGYCNSDASDASDAFFPLCSISPIFPLLSCFSIIFATKKKLQFADRKVGDYCVHCVTCVAFPVFASTHNGDDKKTIASLPSCFASLFIARLQPRLPRLIFILCVVAIFSFSDVRNSDISLTHTFNIKFYVNTICP